MNYVVIIDRLTLQPFVRVMCRLAFYWVSNQLGKHIEEIPGSHSELMKLLLIANLLYNTGLTVVETSVLLFYVRVCQFVNVCRFVLCTVAILIVS